jgi:hypothetical protein
MYSYHLSKPRARNVKTLKFKVFEDIVDEELQLEFKIYNKIYNNDFAMEL